MFTKDELKIILSGVELKISKAQALYDEQVNLAEERGWEISKAAKNSIDYVGAKIERLKRLKAKICAEIKK